jgi:hypothetical protein
VPGERNVEDARYPPHARGGQFVLAQTGVEEDHERLIPAVHRRGHPGRMVDADTAPAQMNHEYARFGRCRDFCSASFAA